MCLMPVGWGIVEVDIRQKLSSMDILFFDSSISVEYCEGCVGDLRRLQSMVLDYELAAVEY